MVRRMMSNIRLYAEEVRCIEGDGRCGPGNTIGAMKPGERHKSEHIGWIRAAVLGGNDGLISTSILVVGVAAAQSGRYR